MHLLKPISAHASHKAPHKAISASTEDGLGAFNKSGVGGIKSIGKPLVPAIMVEFTNKKFLQTTTPEKMTRYCNEPGYNEEKLCVGSVKDFFESQSRGMFVPTFEIIGPIKVDHAYSYYGNC
mgnify:FL=1